MTKIDLPDEMESIGEFAFAECRALSEIAIPSGINEISIFAFRECNFQSIVIPKSVKRICCGAFSSCKSLVKIEILDGLEEICEVAFQQCISLKEIVIPESVKIIEMSHVDTEYISEILSPFNGCRCLEKITAPNGMSIELFQGTPYYDFAKKMIDKGLCPKCHNRRSGWITYKCKKCGYLF